MGWRVPATGVHEALQPGRHLICRWAEARERWGRPALPEDHRVPTRRSAARWGEATDALGEVVRGLGTVSAEDVATWRAVAAEAAGALAVLSGRLERVPGPLARASGLLARSAQGPRQRPAKARRVPHGTIKSVAALVAQADLDEATPAAWRLLLAEVLRVAQAVHDAHVARSDAHSSDCGHWFRLKADAVPAESGRARGRAVASGRVQLSSGPADGSGHPTG